MSEIAATTASAATASPAPTPAPARAESAPAGGAAAKAEKPAASSDGGAPAKKSGLNTVKNGKGSAPRNMGPRYLANFDQINWRSGYQRKEGRRFRKVY